MKRISILILAVAGAFNVHAQESTAAQQFIDSRMVVTANENYVQKITYTKPAQEDYYVDVEYYNGLGDPDQYVQVGPKNGYSIITPVVYDSVGRNDARLYLPYARKMNTMNGGLRASAAIAAQQAYYSSLYGDAEGAAAFSQTQYEHSPLNRVMQTTRAGAVFRKDNKHAVYAYRTNEANEVFRFTVLSEESFSAAYYMPGQLSVFTFTDEDGKTTSQYQDRRGRTVLSRVIADNGFADTYTIYNEQDQPLWVLTPEFSRQLRPAMRYSENFGSVAACCYHYKYNSQGNAIEKRMPGKQAENYVYDAKNRLVLSQDARMAERNEWIYTAYDEFGNTIEQAVVCGVFTPDYVRKHIDDPLDDFDRNANSFVTKCMERRRTLSVIRYRGGRYRKLPYILPPYPDQDFTIAEGAAETVPDPGVKFGSINTDPADANYETFTIPEHLAFQPVSGIVARNEVDTAAWGLKIYEKRYVLDSDTTNYMERAYYYDCKGRVVQTVVRNRDGGICRLSTAYDFTGNVLKLDERICPRPGARADVKLSVFTYDDRGRLLTETTTLNEGIAATVKKEYNALGQPVKKSYGKGLGMVCDTLVYNIQGWLTAQRNKHFNLELYYYNPMRYSVPSYTGNIAAQRWKHATDKDVYTYGFSYDKMGRLNNSTLFVGLTQTAFYTESEIQYDRNGNILTLLRSNGISGKDKYTYSYEGNQLTQIARTPMDDKTTIAVPGGSIYNPKDQAFDYKYDINGNMIHDGLKNLDVTYNMYNLAEEMHQEGRLQARYTWLSDGTKLAVEDNDGSGYAYIGSLVYRNAKGTLSLESCSFGAGRIAVSMVGVTKTTVPYYYLTDHLGSIRVVVDGAGKVLERNDYLPFGLRWNKSERPVSDNRYRFNGKEEQVVGEVGYIDYGARMYDPEIGRWTTQDPLQQNFNAYAFCLNNPVRFVDPDGLWTETPDAYMTDDPKEIEKTLNELKKYQPKRGQTAREVFLSIYSSLYTPTYGLLMSMMISTGIKMGVSPSSLSHLVGKIAYFERFRNHYTLGYGQSIVLTREEFEYIISKGEIDFENATQLEDGSFRAQIDFYGCDFDLKYVFGTAEFTYLINDGQIIPLHFKDIYDFDKKDEGERSSTNEWITRIYGTLVPGTPYDIIY